MHRYLGRQVYAQGRGDEQPVPDRKVCGDRLSSAVCVEVVRLEGSLELCTVAQWWNVSYSDSSQYCHVTEHDEMKAETDNYPEKKLMLNFLKKPYRGCDYVHAVA